MRCIGIVIADRGAAIVEVERDPEDALLVTAIERLPFDLGVVAERVRALEDPEARFIVDGAGLGTALWAVLGNPVDDPHWTLYAGAASSARRSSTRCSSLSRRAGSTSPAASPSRRR